MNGNSIPALLEAVNSYKIKQDSAEVHLCFYLDGFSKTLANDLTFRQYLPRASPDIWKHVSELWSTVSIGFEETASSSLILSLARFTRNLVAEVPTNQEAAFTNEPQIRLLLHRLSSFSILENTESYPLTRMLVQTLSNLVTLNVKLATRLWTLYTTLPEDQNIITRLLASPDVRTNVASLVLILNCVTTDDTGPKRLTSSIGLRIVVLLLDRTETWVDQDTETHEENEAFTIAYRIFEALLDNDLGTTLYHSLSIEGEPVTPHQTTFLKILDSYLRRQNNLQSPKSDDGYTFIAKAFMSLSTYSQRAIRRSLGLESARGPDTPQDCLRELDLRLPRVSVALILLSQCLTTIYLQSQNSHMLYFGYEEMILATQGEGVIENLVETLRLVDNLLPRIVFGQATAGAGQPNRTSTDTTGFVCLKRDLVRLLGTICHERKSIQDRIRECGGIPVVMNLCVVDERNPYLREHALFALRNILHCNIENQRIVDAMKLERK